MKTVSLSRDMVNQGNLILVNRAHPLCVELSRKSLIPICKSKNVMLRTRAATKLEKLFDEMNCRQDIVPVSAYRSKEEQARIYQASLLENGVEFTTKYVMPPDCSEHQSGLAVDLALNQADIDFLRPEFPYEGICGLFRKEALRFGFIERYPEGKEGITGIAHEPWHFRYVGAPHSVIMCEMGVTLEEYLLKLREFSHENNPLRYFRNGADVEIFYLAARKGKTLLKIEDDIRYTVSGDNISGFIITLRKERV